MLRRPSTVSTATAASPVSAGGSGTSWPRAGRPSWRAIGPSSRHATTALAPGLPAGLGRPVTAAHYDRLLGEVIAKIETEVGMERYSNGHFRTAAHLFMDMVKSPRLDDFLTLPAYELLK